MIVVNEQEPTEETEGLPPLRCLSWLLFNSCATVSGAEPQAAARGYANNPLTACAFTSSRGWFKWL